MAIAFTLVKQTPTTYIADITCADADTGPTTQAHGLVGTPLSLILTPLVSVALAAGGNFSVTADATNISITKLGTAGSGGAVPGTTKVMRVIAQLPHSLV